MSATSPVRDDDNDGGGSDTSSLSSALSIQDDEPIAVDVNKSVGVDVGTTATTTTSSSTTATGGSGATGLKRYFKPKAKTSPPPSSPPPPPRPPSPPHEYVLADNPDIAFIVAFRARFGDVFPRSVPNFGPQDIENGVSGPAPGEPGFVPDDIVERFLCALLGLVLNRKKDVEKGHYDRALEDAVYSHSQQWPRQWEGKNPLQQHGEGKFWAMPPNEKITFLKSLILWALSDSDAVQAKLKESYKRTRKEDDINQPLSVQPWGSDSLKRRYWLIEGQDDTHFRVYRESSPATAIKHRTWWSVAGNIEELRAVAQALVDEKTLNSRRLGEKMLASIPRFEVSEEKRKRREYRRARKAAFSAPYYPSYEGRTRGKRLKYTYSDEEDWVSDDFSTRNQRRSNRLNNQQEQPPQPPPGPTYTASGRQVRSRFGGGGGYGGFTAGSNEGPPDADGGYGYDGADRSRREDGLSLSNGYGARYNEEHGEDEDDGASSGEGSEHDGEWAAEEDEGDDDEEDGDDDGKQDRQKSLVVHLAYGKGRSITAPPPSEETPAPAAALESKSEPAQASSRDGAKADSAEATDIDSGSGQLENGVAGSQQPHDDQANPTEENKGINAAPNGTSLEHSANGGSKPVAGMDQEEQPRDRVDERGLERRHEGGHAETVSDHNAAPQPAPVSAPAVQAQTQPQPPPANGNQQC